MIRAMEVANWFLERSWRDSFLCDQLKLYGLTFYAYGWYTVCQPGKIVGSSSI